MMFWALLLPLASKKKTNFLNSVKQFNTHILTLWTSEAVIPALRKLPHGVGSRYTGGTVCQRQAPEVDIPVARYVNARRQPVHRLCTNFPTASEVSIPAARYVNARRQKSVYRRHGMSTPGARSRYTDFVF